MQRPFWSGQLQISLVSFGIQMFPATEAKSEIHFHQLDRRTGQRIRHQNVSSEDAPVGREEIVKGYEYTKGQYVVIEPDDLERLRIPSRQVFQVAQFIGVEELAPEFLEKPYFVVPQNAASAEAFAVVRKALQVTRKIGLGKIAFGGREHVLAIAAPADDAQAGLMGYTLRYAAELRKPSEYFANIAKVEIDKDQLELAEELIKRKVARFDPSRFTDDYESALRTMVEAKVNHAPLPREEQGGGSKKVVNLMDALRRSVQEDAAPAAKKSPAREREPAKKLTLVKASSKPGKSSQKRRSA